MKTSVQTLSFCSKTCPFLHPYYLPFCSTESFSVTAGAPVRRWACACVHAGACIWWGMSWLTIMEHSFLPTGWAILAPLHWFSSFPTHSTFTFSLSDSFSSWCYVAAPSLEAVESFCPAIMQLCHQGSPQRESRWGGPSLFQVPPSGWRILVEFKTCSKTGGPHRWNVLKEQSPCPWALPQSSRIRNWLKKEIKKLWKWLFEMWNVWIFLQYMYFHCKILNLCLT